MRTIQFSFWCFLIVLLRSVSSSGQDYRVHHFTSSEGLPNSTITSLLEDANGYLWIGTYGGGISVFDGTTFETIDDSNGLNTNKVTDLAQDDSLNTWILTRNNIVRFDGLNFKTFEPSTTTSESHDVAFSQLIYHDRTIFFTTRSGQVNSIRRDKIQWNDPLPWQDEKIARLLKLDERRLLARFESAKIAVLSQDTRVDLRHNTSEFTEIYKVIQYGNESLISTDRGLFSIAGDQLVRKFPEIKDRVALFNEIDSTIWTAPIASSEIIKFKISSGKATVIQTFPIGDIVTYAIIDREGSLWFGTRGSGLLQLVPSRFEKKYPLEQPPVQITAIHQPIGSGITYVGTVNDGVHVLKDFALKEKLKGKIPRQNEIRNLAIDDQQNLWIATRSGLAVYNQSQGLHWFDATLSYNILCLETQSGGIVYVGTIGNGLRYLQNNHIHTVPLNGSSNYSVLAIKYFEHRKSVMVSTNQGVFEFINGQLSKVDINTPGHRIAPEVTDITVLTNARIAFATSGAGVFILDQNLNTVAHLSTDEGLISNVVYSIDVDTSERFWVFTNKGINQIQLTDDYKIAETTTLNRYNSFDGIEARKVAFRTNKEVTLFGCSAGLFQMKEDDTEVYRAPFRLTRVELFYGEHDIASFGTIPSGFLQVPQHLTLPPDENHITFHFNQVNKQSPSTTLYRYKLNGFENNWSKPSGIKQVTYSSLPSGSYTFRASAIDNSGRTGPSEIIYPFTIESPFYLKKTFIALASIGSIGLVILIFYIRVNQKVRHHLKMEKMKLEQQAKIKGEIARDYHDELGNKVAKLISHLNTIKITENISTDAFRRIEESAKALHSGSKDFIWSIDPVNGDLKGIFLYIKDFAEKMFEEKNIRFRASDCSGLNFKFPYGTGREIILIFKEAITNTYRHSEAKNVSFTLSESMGSLSFSLDDDGIGLAARGHHSGGLINMQTRARKIGGVAQIFTNPTGGTSVTVTLKLNSITHEPSQKESFYS